MSVIDAHHALGRRQAVGRRRPSRTATVYNPATGAGHRPGRPRPPPPTSTSRSPAAATARRAGGHARSPGGRRCCSRSASWSRSTGGAGPADHAPSTARSSRDAAGEVRRGLEVVEFACGIGPPAQGRLQRERVHRGRRLLDPPAGRRGGRHHAVQLPGHGADVDVPGRHRLRQRLRAQAEREGPVGVDAAGRAVAPRRACPTACSASCTATRRRWTRCWHHPDVRACSFVGSTPIARYVYETRNRGGQAGAGARRGQEPHGRAARRRPRPGRRRGGQRGLRLGGRAVHGHLGGGRGRTRSATSWSAGSPADRRAPDRPTGAEPRLRHGPAGHRRAPGPGRRLRRRRRPGGGRPLVVDGRGAPGRSAARGTASGSAPPCSTTSPRDDAATPTRSSARCSPSCGRPATTRRCALVNDNPYGNGVAIFTNDGGAARRFQFEVEVGMVGINVPIPVPMAYYSFGGWKASLFGDTPHARHRGRPLLHPRQGGHLPLARPQPRRGQPGLPGEQVGRAGGRALLTRPVWPLPRAPG